MESTKLRFSLLIVFLMMLSIDNQTLIAQNNPVNIEGEGGSYKKQFHSNGKISTEVFAPKDIGNSAKGYAKAWDTKGELIYEKQTSCSGLVNSVRFTYFENGAVMKAEYSLHPDGGIQLNKEITSFNENGQITEIKTMSHDDQITAPYPKFPPKPVIPGVTQTPTALRNVNKDSLEFYSTFINKDPTRSMVHERKAFPEKGYTITTWTSVGKLTRDMTNFYKPTNVKVIHRTYHTNGGIETQTIEEVNGRKHFTSFDNKGILVEETITNH